MDFPGKPELSSARGRILCAAALTVTALALGSYGINRSLWLDEAWVANSVLAPSWTAMFHYSRWLQTSPPLFLLLMRGAVHVFGLSNITLRLVPLLLAALAAATMLLAAARIVSLPWAALAAAALVLSPAAVEYSGSAKQYSGEIAAAALVLLAAIAYLQSPQRRRYAWLLAAVLIAQPLSYATAFLLPGLILAVAAVSVRDQRTALARAALLSVVAGATLALEYFLFIRGNVAPSLYDWWMRDPEARVTPIELAVALAVAFLLVIHLAAGLRARDWRAWTQILCLVPCLLLAVASTLAWYPANRRTRLFALPCLLLLAALNAEDLGRWIVGKSSRASAARAVRAAVIAATFLLIAGELVIQSREHRELPEEDAAGAVRYLEARVAPADLLLIHPTAEETFRLYSAIDRWQPQRVVFADTGWPCCPRGKAVVRSTAENVRRNLEQTLAGHTYRTLWFLSTTRLNQWQYIGLDELEVWRDYFNSQHCLVRRCLDFRNMDVTRVDCPAPH